MIEHDRVEEVPIAGSHMANPVGGDTDQPEMKGFVVDQLGDSPIGVAHILDCDSKGRRIAPDSEFGIPVGDLEALVGHHLFQLVVSRTYGTTSGTRLRARSAHSDRQPAGGDHRDGKDRCATS
ncbi:hypothetical protein ABIC28_001660 [Rhodococcus sp. PvR044]|uniref:hypothetical protein n=1 Tax=Rhodococcus sp. PvR044 TaxID=3156402 RepID=UPI003397FCDF